MLIIKLLPAVMIGAAGLISLIKKEGWYRGYSSSVLCSLRSDCREKIRETFHIKSVLSTCSMLPFLHALMTFLSFEVRKIERFETEQSFHAHLQLKKNDSTNLYVRGAHIVIPCYCEWKAMNLIPLFPIPYFPASCFPINFGKTRWQLHLKSSCSTLPISASAQENKKLRARARFIISPCLSPQTDSIRRCSSRRAGQGSFTLAYVNYYKMSWWNTTKWLVIDIKHDKVFESFWGKRRVLRRISSVMWLINERSASHPLSWFREKWVLCCHSDKPATAAGKDY